jgi:Phospholipase_D-nuclease N-terminal
MSFWEVFWDIIWWYLIASIFIAYLFALFRVIGDLFRDPELGGGMKALWLILLIFIPFLTVLTYLIFRGNGMAERSRLRELDGQSAAESHVREVAGPTTASPAEEITKAKSLLDAGTITADEYSSLKIKALQTPRTA